MDAASNNSVEDIRSIKEKINFLPTLAKYRVYIIDEVHMLSTGAFNALLKTLEEPPEHVKFILATTEPQKLLTTILSRCQRFDFKKISNEDLIKRMESVCSQSDIQITKQALNLIATLSEGAARDALSILERCIQDGETNIDENKIKDLVGIPKFVYIHNIIKGIVERDIEKSLKAMEDVLNEGKDLENFLWEMIKHTKDILMYKVSKKNEIYNEEEIKQISEVSEKVSKEEFINIVYKLSELEGKMKLSSQRTILFETGIIKLCAKEDTKGIEERIERLEKLISQEAKVEQNVNKIVDTNDNSKVIPKVIETIKRQETKEVSEKKEEIEEQRQPAKGDIITNWSNVLNSLKKQGKVMLYANLINTEAVEINDMTVVIRFNNGLNSFRKELLEKSENINLLTKEISIVCGKQMQIKFEDTVGSKKSLTTNSSQKLNANSTNETSQIGTTASYEEESILEGLDIPINIIEE